MVLQYACSERNDELYHHGVKGQRWGVRRYQNKDGSLTVAGRQRQKESRRIRQSNQTIGKVRDIEDSMSSEDLYNLGYDKGTTEPGWHNSPDHGKSIVKRFLVYDGDKAVSYADLEEFTSDYKKILNVVIATKAGEENRGKGYATQALDQCVKWFDRNAVKNGYAEINYGVRESNTASRKLAEKAGFKVQPSSEEGWVDYVYTTPKAQFAAEVGAVKACCSTKSDPFKIQPIDRDTVKKRGDLNNEEANTCIRLANQLYDKASKEEPKITSDITKFAAESNASTYGLEYRLKQPTSLAAKIGSDAKGDKTSFDDAAKGIKDAVRYTVVSDGSNFVKSYNSVKAKMESQGYTEVRCKNFFEKYRAGEVQHKAVQCSYETPKGYIFEVQFQTPESQAAKELKVPLYEERRQKGVNQERAAELEKQMHDLAERVPYPPNIAFITSHNKPETKHSIGDDMDAYFAAIVDDYTLSHHGIKGMHWYQRRFQNEDGSLTAAGRVRYGVGQAAKAVATAPGRAAKAVGRAVKKKVRGKYVDYLTRDLNAFDKNKMKLSKEELDYVNEKFRRKRMVDEHYAEDQRIASKNARNLADMADSGKRIADVISSVMVGRTISDLAQERSGFEPKDYAYWLKEQAKIDYLAKQQKLAQAKADYKNRDSRAIKDARLYGEMLSQEADAEYERVYKKTKSVAEANKAAAKFFNEGFKAYCDDTGIRPSDVYKGLQKEDKNQNKNNQSQDDNVPEDNSNPGVQQDEDGVAMDDDEKKRKLGHAADELNVYFASLLTEGDLEHHGVKGMRWYVRRYQPYPFGEAKGKVVGEAAKKERARLAPIKEAVTKDIGKTTRQIAKDLRAAKVAHMTRNLKSFRKNSHLLTDEEYAAAMKKFTQKEDIAKMEQAKFSRTVDYVRLIDNAVKNSKSIADNMSLITTGEDLKSLAKHRRNPKDSEYYKTQTQRFAMEINKFKAKQEESKSQSEEVNAKYADAMAQVKVQKEQAAAKTAGANADKAVQEARSKAADNNERDFKLAKELYRFTRDVAKAAAEEEERAEKKARDANQQKRNDMRDLAVRNAYSSYKKEHPNTEMSLDDYARRYFSDED